MSPLFFVEMKRNYFKYVLNKSSLKKETSAFLDKFPERRTKILCQAIDDAIGGNDRFLKLARIQRQTPFTPDLSLDISDEKIESDCGEIKIRIYAPKSGKSKKSVMYLHGGGWTIGAIDSCQRFCNDCAVHGNCTVVAVEYSLAPETKFPVPVKECREAYKWILQNAKRLKISDKKIIVAGDSSGANLALASTIRINEKNDTLPCGLILFYPVTTLISPQDAASWEKYGRGWALDSVLMESFIKAYLSNDSQKFSQYASPLLYDRFADFPPTLLVASGRDILHDQVEMLAHKMRDAGVKLRYVDVVEAAHIYVTMDGMEKSYTIGLREAVDFIASI